MHKDYVLSVIHEYKFEQKKNIPIRGKNHQVIAYLSSVKKTREHAEILTEWRNKHMYSFFTWFHATVDGTLKWIESIMDREDRILFLIQNLEGKPIGHIGLTNFDFEKNTCEIDSVLRGVEEELPGVMTYALESLIDWVFNRLKIDSVYLRVFEDNHKAISLYKRCGFILWKRVGARKIVERDFIRWVEVEGGSNIFLNYEKYIVYFIKERSQIR